MKLLITSGGTREAIDPVRYLSNGSTGKTGAALASALVKLGHDVTLLHGAGATLPIEQVTTELYVTTEDLRTKLQTQLSGGTYDAVIMAAAVSDYSPETVAAHKINSDEDTLTLRLVRNPKILPQLRGFSPRPIKVVGFKLTVGADQSAREEAVRNQFEKAGVDVVVQNDLDEIRSSDEHLFRWFSSADECRDLSGVTTLTAALDDFLQEEPA
ncbi:MAG: DNA/pantothenate metabolism flavoprotein [Opitutaceae bacterium]|nr:DNA/pantothenate metabolism flavoprotein [Opitutaceae bacterium]|tara:strand:- start:2628 stop:3266 length:639 start_codon:yes stop_codon:yes gene_type:complete